MSVFKFKAVKTRMVAILDFLKGVVHFLKYCKNAINVQKCVAVYGMLHKPLKDSEQNGCQLFLIDLKTFQSFPHFSFSFLLICLRHIRLKTKSKFQPDWCRS
jgi:hypothetical protein